MNLTQDDVSAAIRHAIGEYDSKKMHQGWLKPVVVLILDDLVEHMAPPRDQTFLCVNGMTKKRKGACNKWKREVAQPPTTKGAYLRNFSVYDHECLVDYNVMVGTDDPYETILTAESEGYPGHARKLRSITRAQQNDILWDFYKLLQVPSPVRLMFTLCASKHRSHLRRWLDAMVNRYSTLDGQLPPTTDLWSVSFPTASMDDDEVQLLHWAPGAHDQPAVRTMFKAR